MPTYSADVATILNKSCISCHSDSHVAPFSLAGYENAKAKAAMVALVTGTRRMPPWKAVDGYGEFDHVAKLTDAEILTLKNWSDAGAPRGDTSKEPTPPPAVEGWRMGKPDLILTTKKAHRIEAEGADSFRDYLVELNLKETRWVKAIEFRPSGKNTVHHIIPMLFHKDDIAKLKKVPSWWVEGWNQKLLDKFDPYGVLGMWSTGAPPFVAPEGTGFKVEAGDAVVLDVHYKATGKVEEEQTEVGIYFCDKKPEHDVEVLTAGSGTLQVNPRVPMYTAQTRMLVKDDCTIYMVWPHMHYLGTGMKAWVKYPLGYGKPLVCIRDWDPDWQLVYNLKQPLKVPKGSYVILTGTFDNSTANVRNPNSPPKKVKAGASSKDEMLLIDLYVVKDPKKPAVVPVRGDK